MAYAYGPQGQIMSASQAQGRNTNAIMAGWVDRGPWQYWDTVTATSAATATTAFPALPLLTQYGVFSAPINAQNPLFPGGVKTKLLTNMQQAGTFPPPKCLLLMQLGFYFSSRMLKVDIDAVLDNCYMEFRIDDKIFHEGQLWEFPPGVGLSGVTTQTGVGVFTNGLPAPCYGRRYMDWSKYIAPLQLFSLVINFPGTPPTMDPNGPGLYMPVIMDGLTDRSVQ
jgi:hypothetical protein